MLNGDSIEECAKKIHEPENKLLKMEEFEYCDVVLIYKLSVIYSPILLNAIEEDLTY